MIAARSACFRMLLRGSSGADTIGLEDATRQWDNLKRMNGADALVYLIVDGWDNHGELLYP